MNKHQLHKECIVCKGKKLRSMKDYQTAHLCQCKDCGFVFSKQIPTENELVEHYNRYSRNDYLSPLTIKRYNELLDQFEKYRRNNKLLDVGCGVGYFLDEAQKEVGRFMAQSLPMMHLKFVKRKTSICLRVC